MTTVKYMDANGIERTLTPVQAHMLRVTQRRGGHHGRYPGNADPLAARLLEERGLVKRMNWHCPLSPWCIIGLTELGEKVRRASMVRPRKRISKWYTGEPPY